MVDTPHASPMDQMQLPTETLDLQEPGPSNQAEVPMDTVDNQEAPSNQTEIRSETLDFQDPVQSNQAELRTDTLDVRDSGPSNQTEVLNSVLNNGNSPLEIEVMRDLVHGFSSENLPAVFPGHQNDASDPNKSLDLGLNQKEIPSPFKEDTMPSGGQSSPFLQCPEPLNSAASQQAPEVFDTCTSFSEHNYITSYISRIWPMYILDELVLFVFQGTYHLNSPCVQLHLFSSQDQGRERESISLMSPRC